MQRPLPLEGGLCSGPLFAPIAMAPAQRQRISGGKAVWAKFKRAKPPWVRWADCSVYWDLSAERTRNTGVQHSVEHVVPLKHPLVCGLHCPANLEVVPLAVNVRKGNRWWPDMWQEQLEIEIDVGPVGKDESSDERHRRPQETGGHCPSCAAREDAIDAQAVRGAMSNMRVADEQSHRDA